MKLFFCNNFWLKPCTNFLLPASSSSRQDASNELSLDLERSCWKFDLSSRSWPDPKRSCCMSVDPHRRPEHYGVFIKLVCLTKGIAEKLLVTFHDLKWPWRYEEGSLVTILWFRVSSLPMHRCLRVFRVVFVKKAPFNFLPLTYNGEVAKLTWLDQGLV